MQNQENDEPFEYTDDSYDMYTYLQYEYNTFERRCFEQFDEDNEQGNGDAVKDFVNLQRYIKKIRKYVEDTIRANNLFKELPINYKQSLLIQYMNGHFTHYCDIARRSVLRRGNNNALNDEGRAAQNTSNEMDLLADLINSYNNNHDSSF